MDAPSSLHDRIGGKAAIYTVIETALKKCQADPVLNQILGGKTFNLSKVTSGMTEFVCKLFNGPNSYSGRKLEDCHSNPKKRGQGPKHFAQVMVFIEEILQDLDVPKREYHEAMALLNSCKNDVLGVKPNTFFTTSTTNSLYSTTIF